MDIPKEIEAPAANPLTVIPMIGCKSGVSAYSFTPLTAVLAIPVKNIPANVDFIRIQSAKAAFSGSFHVDTAGREISQKGCILNNPEGLTIKFSASEGDRTFYFPVPAGVIPEGMTVTVGCSTDPETVMTLTTKKPIQAVTGHIALCPEVAFTPVDQKWEDYAQASFLDDFIWGQHSAFTADTWIPVTVQRSGLYPEKFRIANPYTVACQTFGYTPYTEGIVADDYLVITLLEDGLVSFNTFRLGLEDKDSGGKAMQITWAKNWSSSKTGKENKVTTAKDGSILEFQLGPIYSDPDDSGYLYSRDGEGNSSTQRIHIKLDVDEKWTPVLDGTFKDDKIWSLQGFTETVPVTLEESNMVDGSYRIANPYLIAKEQFNYSTYTEGITGDEYVYFTVDENGSARFTTFLAGIEDKASGGKPMKVWYPTDWGSSYSTAYNKVVKFRFDGRPQEVQLSAVLSGPTQAEYSYKYTQVDGNLMHLVFPMDEDPLGPETWDKVCEVRYKDDFIFNNRLKYDADTYIKLVLEQSSNVSGGYRIPNPYPLLADMLGYVIPDYVGEPDEYMYITVKKDGSVYFKPLHAGINLDTKDLTITHPSEVSGKSAAKNKIGALQDSGLPDYIQLAPIYHETGNIGYLYSRDSYDNIIKIDFTEETEEPDYGDSAIVTHQQYPLVPGWDYPAAKLKYKGTTLEKVTVQVIGIDPSLLEGIRLYAGAQWVNAAYVPFDADGLATVNQFTAQPGGLADINVKLKETAVGASFSLVVTEVVVDGVSREIVQDSNDTFHTGIVINHAGDNVNVRNNAEETVASFRIPALVTTNKGTLIAAYDVRYDSSTDLQADIDVGFKRSTDGGKTWSSLGLAMDMGVWGYEDKIAAEEMTWKDAQKQNGIGDPTLLVDKNTGDIFCFAVWAHGHAGSKCLNWAGPGFDIDDTPQLMMVKSSDDGLTWSQPVNLTRQIKRADWLMSFQGPGRGITMEDGTLVIPFQHQEGGRTLNSGVMYSTDHGLTWHTHNLAHTTTSEAAVAEIEPGVLLLTMRDETNSHYRRNFTTSDLGRTWKEHPTNGKWEEPTCEASLLAVKAEESSLGQDLLLLANPATTSGRNHITIRASLDNGITWEGQLLLDQGSSMGYTCLTMVDASTVGILYESSRGNILFQAIPLEDIIQLIPIK